MSAAEMSAADQSSQDWDIGLSQITSGIIEARLNLYSGGLLSDLVQVLRDLRRYIVRFATRRAASSTLEAFLDTVLSPTLQEFYAQEHTYDLIEELLNIIGVQAAVLPCCSVCLLPGSRVKLAPDCSGTRARCC